MQPVHLPPRQPSNRSRQLAGLPLLFLWASESDVRHFGPASNPSQRQAGAWGGSLWNAQPVHCSLEPLEPATSAALKPFSQLAGLPLLFLWASESDVRHFGPPSNPSQRLWPTPASQPCLRQAGAWGGSLWNAQPVHCLFSSDGLPKAALGILDRPQTLLGSWQACLFSWPVPGLPLLFLWASESNVRHVDRPQTLLGSWQASQQR